MRTANATAVATIFSIFLLPSVWAQPTKTVEPTKAEGKVLVTDTKVETKATEKAATDEPELPKPLPGTTPPTDIKSGIKQVETLWGAVKAKAWWLVAAAAIFLVMLILQLTGLFKKFGKRWTWIIAGALSFIAALFLSFNEKGFSWEAFLAFATAGPTIAWLRGFVKKAVLNFQPPKEKTKTDSLRGRTV